MKKYNIILLLLLALSTILSAQNPVIDTNTIHGLRELGKGVGSAYEETNHTGIKNEEFAQLDKAATDLKAVIPETVAPGFKVFDYGSYPILKFMNKENFTDELFAAMEARVKEQTPNYLLIGKHIDPNTGKVEFKVKLSLPVTGNKGGGDSSDIANKIVADCNETFTKEKIDKLTSATSSFLNGGLNTNVNKKLTEGLVFLQTELFNVNLECAKFFTPAGGVIKIQGVKKLYYAPQGFTKGALYGFTIFDKDGNDVDYIVDLGTDKKTYKGYRKTGTIADYFVTENPGTGTIENILFLSFDQTCSIEATAAEYVNPNYFATALIPEISGGSLKLFPDKKYKIIPGRCGLSKKLVEFYEFFPKTVGSAIKQEDIPALESLCEVIAKFENKDIFKSKQDISPNQYVFHDISNTEFINFHKIIESNDFDKFAIFFSKSFLPNDYADWDKSAFENAKKRIELFETNQPIFQKLCDNDNISQTELLSKLTQLFEVSVTSMGTNHRVFHLVFDRINIDARIKLINALLDYQSSSSTPGILSFDETVHAYLPLLILTSPSNEIESKALLANFDSNKCISLSKKIRPLAFYQSALVLSQIMVNYNPIYAEYENTNISEIFKAKTIDGLHSEITKKNTFIPFGFDYKSIDITPQTDGEVKFDITSPDLLVIPKPQQRKIDFVTSLLEPVLIFSTDTYKKGTDNWADFGTEIYIPNILRDHIKKGKDLKEPLFRPIVMPALMLYALKIKTQKEINDVQIVRVAKGAIVAVSVASIVASVGTASAPAASASTVAFASLSIFVNAGILAEITIDPQIVAQFEAENKNFMFVYRAAMIVDLTHGGLQMLKALFPNIAEAEKLLKCQQELIKAAETAEKLGKIKLGAQFRALAKEVTGCFMPETPIYITKTKTLPIKQVPLGSYVLSHTKVTKGSAATIAKNNKISYLALGSEINPDPYTSADQKALDKLDYTKLEMQKVTLNMPKGNGSISIIELLRPTAWLEQNGIAAIGKSTYLNLPEMGLEGYATVTDLAHFRVTKSNTASEEDWAAGLVTGVFKHIANGVYHLRYDNSDTLGVTGTHPLYSLDRAQFIRTEDIKVGEHLLSKSGIITVVAKTYDPTPQEVYNLEVGQWHNFLVGCSGVVAHNGPCLNLKLANPDDLQKGGTQVFNLIDEAGVTTGQLKRVVGSGGDKVNYFYTDLVGDGGIIKNHAYPLNPGNSNQPAFEVLNSNMANVADLNIPPSFNVIYGDLQIPSIVNQNRRGIGSIMFDDAFGVISKKKDVDGIYGYWKADANLYSGFGGESLNLTKFKNALNSGLSKEKAAFETITGTWAKSKGYKNVMFPSGFDPNKLDLVKVIFIK